MLEALLTPESIAVIGASRSPGKVGHEILANLVASGFVGRIVPVNPSAGEVLGMRCFPDLKAYGGKIDLSIVAVPAGVVQAAVRESIESGARAVAVITAGFREIGAEGALWRARLPPPAMRLASACSAPTVWASSTATTR